MQTQSYFSVVDGVVSFDREFQDTDATGTGEEFLVVENETGVNITPCQWFHDDSVAGLRLDSWPKGEIDRLTLSIAIAAAFATFAPICGKAFE